MMTELSISLTLNVILKRKKFRISRIEEYSIVVQRGCKVSFVMHKKVVEQCVAIYLKINTEKTSE